jgi:15-cis-phytoene synthase
MRLQAYCRSLVRGAKTNFYYAFVFLPKAKRDAIYSAYAFSRYTDDIVDNAADAHAASAELADWRKELEACYAGAASHPIGLSLQQTLQLFPIPQQHFSDLVDGVEMDLETTRYETFEDLREYCYRVASVIGLICIEIFGYSHPRTKEYAVSLGIALQLTNILRDIRDDAQRGRIYLPLEDLRRFGCSEEDLLSGAFTDGFRNLMAYECERARGYYREAAELLPEEDRRGMFSAEIMGAIYARLLDRIERVDYDVFHNSVRLSNLRKLWIALGIWTGSRLRRAGRPRA